MRQAAENNYEYKPEKIMTIDTNEAPQLVRIQTALESVAELRSMTTDLPHVGVTPAGKEIRACELAMRVFTSFKERKLNVCGIPLEMVKEAARKESGVDFEFDAPAPVQIGAPHYKRVWLVLKGCPAIALALANDPKIIAAWSAVPVPVRSKGFAESLCEKGINPFGLSKEAMIAFACIFLGVSPEDAVKKEKKKRSKEVPAVSEQANESVKDVMTDADLDTMLHVEMYLSGEGIEGMLSGESMLVTDKKDGKKLLFRAETQRIAAMYPDFAKKPDKMRERVADYLNSVRAEGTPVVTVPSRTVVAAERQVEKKPSAAADDTMVSQFQISVFVLLTSALQLAKAYDKSPDAAIRAKALDDLAAQYINL